MTVAVEARGAGSAMSLHERLFGGRPRPDDGQRWAGSGAMALTGPADGSPRWPPSTLVPALAALETELAALAAVGGGEVAIDAVAMLGERAAFGGLHRRGRVSCGGATRLLAVADGWLAVALPRAEDRQLVPAWLGTEDVAAGIERREAGELVAAGAELGLAVAALGEVTADGAPLRITESVGRPAPRAWSDVLVVDLSSLWAGPLCTSLLAIAGAHVVKVESIGRPDGARFGPAAFYDLLNAGKESVALDFGDATDRARLRALVDCADVVVEASRPRALAQLGVDASAVAGSGAVWLSITGHGRGNGMRVAFGDDAAIAGGLVAGPDEDPCFCADAIADPITGLVGAAVVLDALAGGRAGLVDLSMASLAAWCARGPTVAGDVEPVEVMPPRSRPVARPAAALGADTTTVLRGFGVG